MTTSTSKIILDVRPVPASRPRVSRYGTYYGKNYTEFRKSLYAVLKKIKDKFPPSATGEFLVELEFICKKPKKPSNPYPRGDIDNYVKGVLDGFTYAGMFWEDDIQVVELCASKRYQEEGEDYGIKARVKQLN
ncbi:MAG: hypothetical protein Unbinned200contig1002_44 [Prokaryotic dsDNA virus sp.]|jgi:Holliday junction resolvase RusA-like endonuclease|nr:hypothetical protein [Flavobacteriaceae bacterium]QDP68343.1 MAG: hypothetical protein Unbinned200contig1002_44 [Prokaryotic dsDNA virus sp.]|tara:strand:- start:33066 stop:33464 length:399 start_codon:yes stop_codon:yes gene_type:complete